MIDSWSIIMEFAFLSLLICIGAILKARISILRRWIIPTSMIAGFIGLALGPEVLGVIPLRIDILENFVYHLMGIGFVALSLKDRDVHNSSSLVNSGMIIVSTYLIQGIVGFGLFLVLTKAFYPDMFPGIGLLLPLGYGQGPGQAYSIGNQWEELGVRGGGNLGLTVAGFGFVWATFIGIILINLLVKNKKYNHSRFMGEASISKKVAMIEAEEAPAGDAIDKLSFQLALIGLIYLITYLTILLTDKLLAPLGTYGSTLAQLIKGFHFLIGSIYAMIFRGILKKLEIKKVQLEHLPDNYLLQRISGFSFDFMITASIAAISVNILKEYLWPILILTTVGGLITIFFTLWIVPKAFPQEKLPNVLGFYGMLTGTISTGLALVKAVDPDFSSSTTNNLVVGSATAIVFGFPLLMVLNIPIIGLIQNQPIMYTYAFIALVVYFLILLGTLLYRIIKRA